MLRNASAIKNYAIAATDGRVGTVIDFLFDDTSWLVRWLVVDTGKWLSGRKVLLPPSVLDSRDTIRFELAVSLTMQQVRDSPNSDTDKPVSRQTEADIYDYYGWQPYWGTDLLAVGYGGGATLPLPTLGSRRRAEDIAVAQHSDDDPHLRSTEAVTGYHIHASDGEIGHVQDFLVDDTDWSIQSLVVDTKNWWPGKKVLIAPRSIKGIDWTDSLVNLTIDRKKIKESPPYDVTSTVDQAMMETFP